LTEILKIADKDSRQNLAKNLSALHKRQGSLIGRFQNLHLAQSNYTNIKWSALSNLEELLSIFESNFNLGPNKALWARNQVDVQDALEEIYEVNEVDDTYVGGGTETFEVDIRKILFDKNIEFSEVNLGHQILDLIEEDGAHPSLPTLAKSESEIQTILEKNTDGGIAAFLNKTKTQLIQKAQTVVFIAGVNRVVSNLKSYSQMLRLESTMQQGSDLKATHGLFKPLPHQKVYVVLLDNDRIKLLKNRTFRSLLYDADGTALIGQDNIYRKAMKPDGATAYYDQGIEMKRNAIEPSNVSADIAYASTLSFDKFRSVTTVDYDRLNTGLRKRFVLENRNGFVRKLKRQAWLKILLDRKLMNSEGFGVKKRMLNRIFDSEWRRYRTAPKIAKKTFNQLWASRRKSF